MDNSPTTSHTALEVVDEVTIQHQRRPLTRHIRHQSVPTFQILPQTPTANRNKVFNSFVHSTITNRAKAEIQLHSLLNESEEALPAFVRRAGDSFGSEKLSIDQVSKLLNTQPFIIERLVRILYSSTHNPHDSKILSKLEAQKLTRVLNSTVEVRALVFFMMLDEAGDDYVTRSGLIEFYQQYFKGLKTLHGNRLQEVIAVLLEKFHLHEKIQIDFEEFYLNVSKDPTLLECLSQFTVNPTWFMNVPSREQEKKSKIRQYFSKWCCTREHYERLTNKLSFDYMKDNLSRIFMLTLYLLINLGLFLFVVIYRAGVEKDHVLAVIARIGGMLLNFNCTFVIILMLKKTILLIRTNKLMRKLLPVDDHIDFHKVVGRVIAILAIIHTIAHIANFARLDEYSWLEYMFTTKPDIGWVGGFASLSGFFLCIILVVIVIGSMQWIRRGGHFEIFYWTHLLYLPFYVFLILHAQYFWKWVIGPLTVLLLEKMYSVLTRFSSRNGRTYIHAATIEQSNVISLTIHRPKNFNFQPGDYVSINLPRVALYEFHPFTISSAPEQADYICVHIQAVGNWTKQVYQRFKEMSDEVARENQLQLYRGDLHPEESIANLQNLEQSQIDDETDDERIENTPTESNTKSKKREPIFIKGPYSSCARYVFDCKHVVLIGGGIGVTPYASILSSLMAQFRASTIVCKHCNRTNYLSKRLIGNHRLEKVDFIWVNRDYKNFEWFLNLLRQFEEEQDKYLKENPNEKRFLDIHLYFTEIKHDENIGNVPLELVTKIWAEVAGQDIFTSLRSKTHIGRPQWDKLFNKLISGENASTANDVNIFFCGPSTMARTIQQQCAAFRFRFYEEKF